MQFSDVEVIPAYLKGFYFFSYFYEVSSSIIRDL